MARELTMPKLSDSMADAVIVRWLKSPGEPFARGEPLIEVETDKATVVYEAESDGTLDSILVDEGATVSIGQPIATLANADGPAPRQEQRQRVSQDGDSGEVDVLELTATQATIARRMVESATTIPVFTVTADVDMSLIAALRRGAQEESGEVPSVNDFIVKAAALTLREFPRFNASYVDGKVECYSRINVGIAVATEGALLVPVVSDADRKTLAVIAADTRRLADAARRRALRPEDLRDGTFTVSNLGMFGVRSFTAIVDPPQVAILAVGALDRSDVMSVTLSCDHRVVYGADGARFLSRLRELLERPLVLTTGGR
jgi:pyruvate dehydrogenase E2 component (dihydrolipoamide acetyltransferase)